jgi:hypothetical protein|tara:strand:- start:9645 stop:9974 length:330 start_codon:yes stop_codon:yes gene_type:complete
MTNLEIPEFLKAKNRPVSKTEQARRKSINASSKQLPIKKEKCPKDYKEVIIKPSALRDRLLGYRSRNAHEQTYFVKDTGWKWVYLKETKPKARNKELLKTQYNKLLEGE